MNRKLFVGFAMAGALTLLGSAAGLAHDTDPADLLMAQAQAKADQVTADINLCAETKLNALESGQSPAEGVNDGAIEKATKQVETLQENALQAVETGLNNFENAVETAQDAEPATELPALTELTLPDAQKVCDAINAVTVDATTVAAPPAPENEPADNERDTETRASESSND